MLVTVLGTSAACPSKYRNVTGIYVEVVGRGGMLVDCGEGTWGQLVRCVPILLPHVPTQPQLNAHLS